MDKKRISRLLRRYLSGDWEGDEPDFEAEEIDELLDGFEKSDDYTHYEEILALGLRLYPDNAGLLLRKCGLLIHNGDYANALTLIDSVSGIVTDRKKIDKLRLECYVFQGDYNKAIEYIGQLTDRNCDYIESLYEEIAPILNYEENLKGAGGFVRRGLSLFPDNLVLKYGACRILELSGDIDGALRIDNELIGRKPYNYDFWSLACRLYAVKGEYEKAIEAFDFALVCKKPHPKGNTDPALLLLRAFCLFMKGSYEAAIGVFKEIIAGIDDNQEISKDMDMRDCVIPLIAECYVKMGNYEKAYALLKQLMGKKLAVYDSLFFYFAYVHCHESIRLKLMPISSPLSVYLSYIRCCAEIGRDEEAADCLKETFRLFPHRVRLRSIEAFLRIVKEDTAEKESRSPGRPAVGQNENGSARTPDGLIPAIDLAREYLSNGGNRN